MLFLGANINDRKSQLGWWRVYVAAVLDLFSRRIVGWAMEGHMRESLVHDALMMALQRR